MTDTAMPGIDLSAAKLIVLACLLLVLQGCDFANIAVLQVPYRGCCEEQDRARSVTEVVRSIEALGYREWALVGRPDWTFYGDDVSIKEYARPGDTYANFTFRVVVPAHRNFMHVWIKAFNACLRRDQLEMALRLREQFSSTFLTVSRGCPERDPVLRRALFDYADGDGQAGEIF